MLKMYFKKQNMVLKINLNNFGDPTTVALVPQQHSKTFQIPNISKYTM